MRHRGRRVSDGLFAGLVLAAGSALAAGADTRDETTVKKIPGTGAYAVVVSEQTYADAGWRKAVEALISRHKATLLVYSSPVSGTRAALAEVFPRYACFVAQPEEANRAFVVAVHRLTRALDDDPYTDVFWGILTGYDAEDALRIATHDKPLIITRGAGGTSLDLDAFQEGLWFSEGEKGAKFVKLPGRSGKEQCPDDSTAEIVETLNTFRPQIFVTSGHATPRDWQIGYSYRNGQFRCQDGQLFGLDLAGKKHLVNSPEPKVYLPAGNCLMGLIPDRQAMALAWIHTGGAYQMIGYVVSTFYGRGGWGTRDYFIGQADRFTFNEAFIANNIALVHELETRFPKNAKTNLDEYDLETDETLLGRLTQKHHVEDKDELGLLWDRDTVAFYGDPAWPARMAATRSPAWRQTLTEQDGLFTLKLICERNGGFGGKPAVQFLPRRVRNVELLEGRDLRPVIADNFVLLPDAPSLKQGDTLTVVFTARPAR